MMEHITLRSYMPEDEEFLFRLFISSRPDLQWITGLDTSEREALLYHQFWIEKSQLEKNYPKGQFDIVLYDGIPIGKFYVYVGIESYRIIDIALLQEYRELGIGSSLIRELTENAALQNKKIFLQVAWYNRQAKGWYLKLGFTVKEDNGVFSEMIWRPELS